MGDQTEQLWAEVLEGANTELQGQGDEEIDLPHFVH
jgi:hypothetical protein